MKTHILKNMRAAFLALAASAALAGVSSCERAIYDYEGDCTVNYLLKFRYDLNLKWADAFANEVKSVRLYVFDENGTMVKEIVERGSRLADPEYAVNLELPAGKYHLLAWCGINNEGTNLQFDVPAATPGKTVVSDQTCRLMRKTSADYAAYSDERHQFMFHGELDVDLPENEDGGEYVYTMPLTKDTNHIRIILQQLSGNDVDVDLFNFRIDDANGYYAADNSLLPDDKIAYLPFDKKTGVAGVGKDDTRAIIDVRGAIADFSVGRMMADHSKDMMLTITNNLDEVVAQVPVIQYALLAKEYYEEAYGHEMSEQEFLDREDEYVLTFFLDESRRWIDTVIMIHSWRIVLHDYELE